MTSDNSTETVIYRTSKPRYVVQQGEPTWSGPSFWCDLAGFDSKDMAIEEAERLQGLWLDGNYRVVDTQE
jgi:hypothetical protein